MAVKADLRSPRILARCEQAGNARPAKASGSRSLPPGRGRVGEGGRTRMGAGAAWVAGDPRSGSPRREAPARDDRGNSFTVTRMMSVSWKTLSNRRGPRFALAALALAATPSLVFRLLDLAFPFPWGALRRPAATV